MTRLQPQPGLLEKLFAAVAGLLLLTLGFMFSVVLFAVIAVVGLIAWGYFRWKTRDLRKAMQEQERSRNASNGNVIDGEAVVVEEYVVREDDIQPRHPPGPKEH